MLNSPEIGLRTGLPIEVVAMNPVEAKSKNTYAVRSLIPAFATYC